MLNISQRHAIDRPILNSDYIRFITPSLNFVNGENNQIFIDVTREDNAKSTKDNIVEIDFSVTH